MKEVIKKNDILGVKFYRQISDNDFQVLRVIEVDGDRCKLLNVETNKRFHMKIDLLYKRYTAIKPHGTLVFVLNRTETCPEPSPITDIMVMGAPYGVVKDEFLSRQIRFNPLSQYGFGCMRSDSSDLYDALHKFDFQISYRKIHTYINDDIKSICRALGNYRVTLDKEFKKNYYNKKRLSLDYMDGLAKNLKEFLTIHGVWYMYDKMLNIIESPYYSDEKELFKSYLESVLCREIKYIDIIKYDLDVKLDSILIDYSLVRDPDGNVVVATFVKGEAIDNTISKEKGLEEGIMSEEELAIFESLKK